MGNSIRTVDERTSEHRACFGVRRGPLGDCYFRWHSVTGRLRSLRIDPLSEPVPGFDIFYANRHGISGVGVGNE